MLRVFALLLFVQFAAPAKKKSSLAKNSAPSLSSALAKGDELRQAGALDEAEAVYAAAAKLHPTRSEPLFFLGMTARAGGRTDEAMAQYKATLRLAPQTAEAHMNLASVLSTLDDRDAEALLHYEQALALREWPEKLAAQAEYNSAISLSGLDRADEAAAAARRSLELAPEFDQAAELIEQLEEEAGAPATAVVAAAAARLRSARRRRRRRGRGRAAAAAASEAGAAEAGAKASRVGEEGSGADADGVEVGRRRRRAFRRARGGGGGARSRARQPRRRLPPLARREGGGAPLARDKTYRVQGGRSTGCRQREKDFENARLCLLQ